MDRWQNKPLSINETLDLSFRIMKEHFSSLFLITVLFMVPLYLLEALAMWISGTELIQYSTSGEWYTKYLPAQYLDPNAMPDLPIAELITGMLTSLVLYLFSLPVAEGATLLYLDRVRNGESPAPLEMVKQTLSRFWPLLGGSLIYGFIAYGAYMVLTIIIVFFVMGIFAVGLFGESLFLTVLLFVGVALVVLAGVVGTVYLLARLGFYFPFILFKGVLPGFAESWRMTKNQFWRIFGILVVIIILSFLITGAFEALFMLIFGYSVVTILLAKVGGMFAFLMFFVVYGVLYFDLQLRTEATDLKEMIATYQNTMAVNPLPDKPIDANENEKNMDE